jgi:Polyketide cyclase / dehydrase and lipid transport
MQTFQNTVTIARPVGEVFAFLANLRNIPRWNYAIARTVPASPGLAGAGATYRQTRTIPRRSEESLQITVFQPPPASPSRDNSARSAPRPATCSSQCRAGPG